MASDVYDFIIINNVPAFYKINLFNELAKSHKIKVVFIANNSNIRNSDFTDAIINFEHVFITNKNYEERSKFFTFLKVSGILVSSKYKRLLYPGWELVELIPLMFFLPKNTNAMVLESSIVETKSSGFLWWVKRIIMMRVGHIYPSGILQKAIADKAKFTGELHLTHGVGIPNRLSKREIKYDRNIIFRYLYVGRISTEKNLEYLIEIFNDNGKMLTIVGDGPIFDTLFSKANSNIQFLGYVDNKSLASIYLQHDIFILPSYSEPWGLVIDEALWFGLPVIVSENVGSSEDLVIKTKTGGVFKLNNNLSLEATLFEVEENYLMYKNNVLSIDFTKRDKEQVDSYFV
jgi:glycosyltransferase involved in cell wall biosynthesis